MLASVTCAPRGKCRNKRLPRNCSAGCRQLQAAEQVQRVSTALALRDVALDEVTATLTMTARAAARNEERMKAERRMDGQGDCRCGEWEEKEAMWVSMIMQAAAVK
jgi:hypothetical protein